MANSDPNHSLVAAAQNGDAAAVGELIRTHQSWVFNFVLRMASDHTLAQDLTQEILLKAVRGLPNFRGDSQFRTWLYRIAFNHVLSMEETGDEAYHRTQGRKWAQDAHVEAHLDQEIADPRAMGPDLMLLVQETMVKCVIGMLVCLNRRSRAVFILGEVLDVEGKEGAQALGLTAANFRQILSRSRQRLLNFLHDRCSLINPSKPCTCQRSTPVNLKSGYVDPLNLVFRVSQGPELRDLVSGAQEQIAAILRPLQASPELSPQVLDRTIRSAAFQNLVSMPPRD